MTENLNNLLSRYLNQYSKNPTSRVFAPLAECYRKIGMIDEAVETLKKGLKFYPDYQLGYLVLGNCYADEGNHSQAYKILKPLVEFNTDNLKLHKLFANVCIELRYDDEALNSLKNILFINPYDKEVAEKIAELEDLEAIKEKFQIKREKQVELDVFEEDWVALDLSNRISTIPEEEVEEMEPEVEDIDQWAMQKEHLSEEKEDLEKENLQTAQQKIEEVEKIVSENEEPFVTQTLIDIYISQQHYDKAIEMLERMLELNPGNLAIKSKLNKVLKKVEGEEETYYQKLEKKYMMFLNKIQIRAMAYTGN